MVAIYPTDAVIDTNSFSTTATVQYNNTSTNTLFNLGSAVTNRGEVLAISDQLLLRTSSYEMTNSNFTVSFLEAPNASNLTLKSITLPSSLTAIKKFPIIRAVDYANGAANVISVESTDYVINGVRTAWRVPLNSTPSSNSDLLISISGNVIVNQGYVFPSTTLGTNGIDVTPALDGNDTTLSIRTFNDELTETCRKESMADRKPDKGFSEQKQFDVSTFEAIAGYEKRRLISRRPKRSWQISYGALTGAEKDAIQTFHTNRNGDFEAFFFDLSHVQSTGTATVRFDSPVNIVHIGSRGTTIHDAYYNINFKLKEVFD